MAKDILHNEKELLEQVAAGSHAAFTVLFNQRKDRIYQIALTFGQSDTIAEEIVQDVFLNIWLKRSDLLSIQDLESYLFIVTRNAVYRTLRLLAVRERKLAALVEEGQSPLAYDYLELLVEKDYHHILEQAIHQLPPQQQQVYRLSKLQGLKREEVAEQMQLHPETVKRHLALAMKTIRAYCIRHLDLPAVLIAVSFLNKV